MIKIIPYNNKETLTQRGIYGFYVDDKLIYIGKAKRNLPANIDLWLNDSSNMVSGVGGYMQYCDALGRDVYVREIIELKDDSEIGDNIEKMLIDIYKPHFNLTHPV